MNEIPTIEVKNPLTGGKMIINKSDYSPDEHELWEEQSETAGETVEETSEEEQPARKRRERRSEVAE